MGSGSLTNELLDLFNDSPEIPTSSAFCQQRCKITVEAFEAVFRLFSKKLCDSFEDELPVLAVDGSKIQIRMSGQGNMISVIIMNGIKNLLISILFKIE